MERHEGIFYLTKSYWFEFIATDHDGRTRERSKRAVAVGRAVALGFRATVTDGERAASNRRVDGAPAGRLARCRDA
ncbi:hypothetical protein [Burkholderia pseudomallei]|uniref:hypothetical protein n=1 Tax=Burkholderia pseudomallei TaxID=28450 RepID=UPI0009ABE12B|nr:hypothetical protein [Burkholderia pseudomallei]